MSIISRLSLGNCFTAKSRVESTDASFQARIHMIRVIAVNTVELDLVEGDIERIREVTDSSLAEILGAEEAKATLVDAFEGALVKYNGDDQGLLTAYHSTIRARISDDNIVKDLLQIMTDELTSSPPRIVTLNDLDSYPMVDIFREAELERLPRRSLEHGMYGTSQDVIVCPICMECVELGTVVIQLACGHWYHPLCITQWLRVDNSCPACRRKILLLPHISFL